jgi:hypothetical protein
MRARALVLIALMAAPAYLAAQSPVMGPKQTAQRAVNRTNAHTAAMTDTTAGRSTASPSSPAVASNSKASMPAKHTAPNDTTKARVTTSTGATAKPERATFEREVFSYERSGRRDPFTSLMTSSEIRPLFADLRLVGVAYDPTGRSSVAVLREDAQELRTNVPKGAVLGAASAKAPVEVPQYRVREGQQLGRMRVARIGMKSVTFTIEEFGYSRQETLTLSDSNTEKKP